MQPMNCIYEALRHSLKNKRLESHTKSYVRQKVREELIEIQISVNILSTTFHTEGGKERILCKKALATIT
jgi:hypothetical protein